MEWVYLILAGCFEVVGVIGFNRVQRYKNLSSYLFLFIGFIISFSLLSLAMRTLPAGLSYAVWTGIGTLGAAVIGMVFYGESRDWRRLLFIGCIVAAVMGLKLVS